MVYVTNQKLVTLEREESERYLINGFSVCQITFKM